MRTARTDRRHARASAAGALLIASGALGSAGCTYEVTIGGVTTHAIVATACGTWDSAGHATSGGYFVGHSAALPDDTVSYFVFDLGDARGGTVMSASVTIPGTSDWKITVPSADHTPALQFKLGATPLPASLTLAQVTGGSVDTSVYHDVRAEQDLGFAWFPSGSPTHTYDAFHYDNGRLQDAVDAGGPYPIFAVRRFGDGATTEEYFYGGSDCARGVVLTLTVR